MFNKGNDMSKAKFYEFVSTVEGIAGDIDDVGHGVLWASGRIAALEDEVADYKRLATRIVTGTTSRWALEQLIIKARAD